MKFATRLDAAFQVQISERGRRWTEFPKIGEDFAQGRFSVTGYRQKEVMRGQLRVDASEVDVRDNATGESFQLVRGALTRHPDKFAKFRFALDSEGEFLVVKLGETFSLSAEPGELYRLEEVGESGAKIIGLGSQQAGKPISIEIAPNGG